MSGSNGEGRVLGGRYRLEQPLGDGGMGRVWAGRDQLLGRPVAVKEVRFLDGHDSRTQSELVERSMREARAASRLSHPGVVTIYDVVEEDGRPWIVMQRLVGRTLADVVREDGPLAPARVARIGLQVLDGLAAAHAAGVLHRDVKPSNVLLDADDRAVLTDFGIAQSSGDASLTRTGLLVGSPAYLSPERARGEPATEASDLWALGATLFAAASGHSPFDRGEALPTLAAVVGDPVRPPLSAGALRPALEGLLRKDPARRFDTGQARAALETAAASGEETPTPVQGVPVPGTEDLGRTVVVPPVRDPVVASPSVAPAPPPRAPRPRRPFSGGRLLAVLAAVVLVLLIAGLLHSAGSGGEPSAGGPSTTPSTNRPSGSASRTPSRSSSAPATKSANVPAGYHLHRDPTGFTVAVPDGWSQRRDGSRVDFVEPGGRRFLRIDQTDSPKADPVKDWQQQEKSVRQRLRGYHRISIEAVDYRDYKTADWEFTFGSGSGRTHVLDRGLTTGDRGYAIYWSTPDSAWSASSDMLRVSEASFQPAS